jgi:hypothetical protein
MTLLVAARRLGATAAGVKGGLNMVSIATATASVTVAASSCVYYWLDCDPALALAPSVCACDADSGAADVTSPKNAPSNLKTRVSTSCY